MSKIIELPIIICGELKMPKEHYIEIKYSKDVIVRITKPTKEDLDKIYNYNVDLSKLKFSEVSKYIAKFSLDFLREDNQTRLDAIELSSYITGYTKKMLERDYDIICDHLSAPFTIYDIATAELGDYRMLDEWVHRQLVKIKAFPRGRAFHVLVGNVPMTGIFSVFRSIITKNQTVVKLPSRDLVSTLYFMKGLIESNSDGEAYQELLNSSLSVFYLEKEGEELKELIESSDVVCAWGKGSSLKRVKEMVPHSVPYVEFGPKRSYSLLYTNKGCNLDTAAIRMAHDLCIYDQEACLSPQRLFVIGEYEEYVKVLEKWLNWQSKYLPRGIINDDAESHLYRHKLEAMYNGMKVVAGEPDWRIIVCSPYDVIDHPLGRTLFIHPIKSEDEMLPFIDDETQTISVFPYRQDMYELADLLCKKGISKLCETGMAFYPRDGWTHDAMYPLQYFVRLCFIDATSEQEYKYDPLDDELAWDSFSKMFGGVPYDELEEIATYYTLS